MNASRYLPFVGRLFIGLPFKRAAYGPGLGNTPSVDLG